MSTHSYLWYIKPSSKGCIVPCNNRAVTKFLSCWVYAASRWETEQPKSSLYFILLMFRLKVARDHAHSCWGKSPAPGPLWQRWIKSPQKLELVQWFCWLFAPSATETWRNSELNQRCVWAMYINQAPVVQKVDNAIYGINHLPLDSVIGFPNSYRWDSDLFSG